MSTTLNPKELKELLFQAILNKADISEEIKEQVRTLHTEKLNKGKCNA